MFIFKPAEPKLTPRDFPLLLRYEWRVDRPLNIARRRALDAMKARRASGSKTPRPQSMIDRARLGRRTALKSRVTEVEVERIAKKVIAAAQARVSRGHCCSRP